jgi:hypothetical protein
MCLRISDCWLRCMDLACVWHIIVRLVVLRRISVVVGLVFWVRVEVMMWRLIGGWWLQRLMPVGCVIDLFSCAWCRRLVLLLSHLLFRFEEDRTIPCLMISIFRLKHAVQWLFLKLASALAGVASSILLMIFSWVIHYVLTFLSRRSEVFILVLWRFASIRVNVVNLLVRCIESCYTLFVSGVLEWSWTFILACYFPLLIQLAKVRHLRSAEFSEFFQCFGALPD